VQILDGTIVELRKRPFREAGVLSPEERFNELVDRLVIILSDLADRLGKEAATLEGKTGEKARSLHNKVLAMLQDLQRRHNG